MQGVNFATKGEELEYKTNTERSASGDELQVGEQEEQAHLSAYWTEDHLNECSPLSEEHTIEESTKYTPPKKKARIQSMHNTRFRDIPEPLSRDRARSFGLGDVASQPVRSARDSLQISQPAPRTGQVSDQESVDVDMDHQDTSAKDYMTQQAHRSPKDSLPVSENVWFMGGNNEHQHARVGKGLSDLCFNPMSFPPQVHLPHPAVHSPAKAKATLERKKEMPRSPQTTISSAGDELIANLTSAWYWTGYYAGYQQRIVEE